jgi:hypothetical protein
MSKRQLTLPLRELLLLHWLLLHLLLPLLLRHTHHPLHSLTHHHLLLHLLKLLWVKSTIHHPHIWLWDLHIEVKQSGEIVRHLTHWICLPFSLQSSSRT